MATVQVWAWVAGEDCDANPIVERVLADAPTRPAGVPAAAWLAEQDVAAWRDEIAARLRTIDARSIRALREGDAARVAALEADAANLRAVLRSLAGG